MVFAASAVVCIGIVLHVKIIGLVLGGAFGVAVVMGVWFIDKAGRERGPQLRKYAPLMIKVGIAINVLLFILSLLHKK